MSIIYNWYISSRFLWMQWLLGYIVGRAQSLWVCLTLYINVVSSCEVMSYDHHYHQHTHIHGSTYTQFLVCVGVTHSLIRSKLTRTIPFQRSAAIAFPSGRRYFSLFPCRRPSLLTSVVLSVNTWIDFTLRSPVENSVAMYRMSTPCSGYTLDNLGQSFKMTTSHSL